MMLDVLKRVDNHPFLFTRGCLCSVFRQGINVSSKKAYVGGVDNIAGG